MILKRNVGENKKKKKKDRRCLVKEEMADDVNARSKIKDYEE